METFYIKARMYLTKYNEKDNKVEKIKITRDFLEAFQERGLGTLKNVLNKHLLDYALDKNAFTYRQELRLEDLAEYSDLDFIKSILPIHIGVDIDYTLTEKDYPIYLYFKVLSNTPITDAIQLKQILDELSGQLTDGWGEGFEQRHLDLSGYVYDETAKKVIYIEDKGYYLSSTTSVQLEIVPKIT